MSQFLVIPEVSSPVMYCSWQVHIIPYNFVESQSLCDISLILTYPQVDIMTLHHISIVKNNPYVCLWIAFVVFSVFQKKIKIMVSKYVPNHASIQENP